MANSFEVPEPGNDLLEKTEKVRLASIKIRIIIFYLHQEVALFHLLIFLWLVKFQIP